MVNIIAGPIYTDQEVQSIEVIALLILLFLGIVLGIIVYLGSKLIVKMSHQGSTSALSFVHSIIIGLVLSATAGVVFYFAS